MITSEAIWEAAIAELKLVLPGPTFQAWLREVRLEASDFVRNDYTIGVRDQRTLNWLRYRLHPVITRTLAGVSGRPATVTYVLVTDDDERSDSVDRNRGADAVPDWADFGVPEIFEQVTLDNTDWTRPALKKLELQSYAQNFLDHARSGVGLTLFGPPGTGKTHLAVCLLKVAVGAGWTAKFSGAAPVLDELRASFEPARQSPTTRSERQILGRLTKVRLLVLDDLRLDALSVWGRDRLYSVFNPRWEARLPTIVTSNYSPDELAAGVGRDRPGMDDGTLSRLVRSSLTLKLEGSDYRLEAKRAALSKLRRRATDRLTPETEGS